MWSSCPFDLVVGLAEIKLQNGSSSSLKYVLVLWMIRAGLMANPLDLNSRSLIASQMASLFNLSDDLARMIAFYPSEPVLAMACRNLTNQLNGEHLEDQLFFKMEELFESVQADRGQLHEIVGTMVVLKAIDAASDVCFLENHSYSFNDSVAGIVDGSSSDDAVADYVVGIDSDNNNNCHGKDVIDVDSNISIDHGSVDVGGDHDNGDVEGDHGNGNDCDDGDGNDNGNTNFYVDTINDSVGPNCDSMAYLKNMLQDFGDLWGKKQFVLEPTEDTESPYTIPVTSFPDYHVTTVNEFLEKLLPAGEFEKMKENLPKTTLSGLVNASHSVKLIRTRNGFVFKGEQIKTMNLPLADDRITDKNCNLVGDALLKLGLAHQCCFLMPDRYYGYDLIVPVLLEDGSFSFIAVQFKASDVAIGTSIEKMQARFHYVKCPISSPNHQVPGQSFGISQANQVACPRCSNSPCPNSGLHEHQPLSCNYCISRAAPGKLFKNQICLLLNLDPQDSKKFKSEIVSPLDEKDGEYESALTALLEVLDVNSEPAANWMTNVKITSEEFKKPLLSRQEPVVDGTSALLSSLWFDDLVNLRELKITDRNTINFRKDGFLHRQYCLGVRGIDSFKHLFAAKNSMENAKKLLMEEVDFFKLFQERNEIPSSDRLTISCESLRKLAYLKSVLNDASVN